MSYCTQCGTQLLESEETVRQYNIATLSNWIRVARAEGQLTVTNKRVIFTAEGCGLGGRTAVNREFAISEIAGIDTSTGYRFSVPVFVIGLASILAAAVIIAALTFVGGWGVTNIFVPRPLAHEFVGQGLRQVVGGQAVVVTQLSLVVGLVAGFGGAALYFVLRGKLWFRLLLLGVSLGAFFVVALTGNGFSYALFAAAVVVNMYGLAMFARLPDLVVTVYGKGGASVDMVRAKNGFVGIFRGTGYAQAAPTQEAAVAISELGAVIAEMQSQGLIALQTPYHQGRRTVCQSCG